MMLSGTDIPSRPRPTTWPRPDPYSNFRTNYVVKALAYRNYGYPRRFFLIVDKNRVIAGVLVHGNRRA